MGEWVKEAGELTYENIEDRQDNKQEDEKREYTNGEEVRFLSCACV
jgi:hypothetical protein